MRRGGGSSPGRLATVSCKSSPLSAADFFFLLLFKSFSSLLSLTLSSFLPLFFSFTFYHFLLVSLFQSPFFLLTFFLSLFLPFSLFSHPSFFATLLSFVSFSLPSSLPYFFLSFSGLGNTLRGFGGKVGNFWALEGANRGGGYRPKSESGG